MAGGGRISNVKLHGRRLILTAVFIPVIFALLMANEVEISFAAIRMMALATTSYYIGEWAAGTSGDTMMTPMSLSVWVSYATTMLFIITANILVETDASDGLCRTAVLLCVNSYAWSKIAMYNVLVEKYRIVSGRRNLPRKQDRHYQIMIASFIPAFAAVFVTDTDHHFEVRGEPLSCYIGIPSHWAMVFLSFDVYFTGLLLFFYLRIPADRHTVSRRGIIGSCILIALPSVFNNGSLYLHKWNPRYRCLTTCVLDVWISGIVTDYLSGLAEDMENQRCSAEEAAILISGMRLDEMKFLREIETPNRVQESFIRILNLLEMFRPFLPDSLLRTIVDDEQVQGGDSSSASVASKSTKTGSEFVSTRSSNRNNLELQGISVVTKVLESKVIAICFCFLPQSCSRNGAQWTSLVELLYHTADKFRGVVHHVGESFSIINFNASVKVVSPGQMAVLTGVELKTSKTHVISSVVSLEKNVLYGPVGSRCASFLMVGNIVPSCVQFIPFLEEINIAICIAIGGILERLDVAVAARPLVSFLDKCTGKILPIEEKIGNQTVEACEWMYQLQNAKQDGDFERAIEAVGISDNIQAVELLRRHLEGKSDPIALFFLTQLQDIGESEFIFNPRNFLPLPKINIPILTDAY